MPEGDTIHHAANRIRPVLEGRVPDEIRTPQRRHDADRWPERLRRAGGATASRRAASTCCCTSRATSCVHSHLRMTGAWDVYARRRALAALAAARVARAARAAGSEVVQFDGPLLELMTEARSRSDPRLAGLGQDVLGERFDEALLIRRLREDDPTRPFGDALHRPAHDRRASATSGSRSRASPPAPIRGSALAQTADDDGARRGPLRPRAHGAVGARRLRRAAARRLRPRRRAVPALRRRRSAAPGQGEQNRTTYWCPGCQR